MSAFLEHANITVTDPQKTADTLCDLFGWRIRWSGGAIDAGHSIHVGSETSYLALYNKGEKPSPRPDPYTTVGGLNHLAVVVDDFEATRDKVIVRGYTPGQTHDYEPGRRFYFHDDDGIEFEVVSYD